MDARSRYDRARRTVRKYALRSLARGKQISKDLEPVSIQTAKAISLDKGSI